MRKKFFNKYSVMGITDVGHVRQHNEDNILIDDALNLLIVADGMGGHQAGEVASKEAIKVIQQMLVMQQRNDTKKKDFFRFFNKQGSDSDQVNLMGERLETALEEANHHLYQLNIERNAFDGTGMGTTIAGCWLLSAEVMLVFHIGDSRVYRFRNEKLQALTRDHSILQQWEDGGCIGEQPKSNVILKAVGPYPTVVPDIQIVQIKSSDTFLICSDGLTDMVENLEVEKKLQGLKSVQIESYCQKLLNVALDSGGKDNISIILMTQD